MSHDGATACALAGLAAVAAGLVIFWRAYTWGRAVGFGDGYDYGERDGFRQGFSRGVVVTTHAWQTSVDESSLLVDLSEGRQRERN